MEELENIDQQPLSELGGVALVKRVVEIGPEVLIELNHTQETYLAAKSRRLGVKWPEGFFASSLDRLMS